MFTLNCRGKIVSLHSPVLMGIINITPDSFYQERKQHSAEDAVSLAGRMISEGAAILDLGGQSTRPGSGRVPVEEELKRIIPVIEKIRKNFPEILISIDTYQSIVASEAITAGANIINDISAGEMDQAMIPTVAKLKVPYICMHMKGRPETMHLNSFYENIAREVLDFFIKKIDLCKQVGIHDIIIDPGFGFGKTPAHNFQLLRQLPVFKMLEKPILAGLSRKSTIYKTLGVSAAEALNGTTVLNTLAIQNGASILRVHDVKEAAEAIQLIKAYNIANAVELNRKAGLPQG